MTGVSAPNSTIYPPPPPISGVGHKSRFHSGALYNSANKVKKRLRRGLALIASFALLAFSLGASIQQAAAQAAELPTFDLVGEPR
ncbi:MAG: hypothetical protein OXE54_00975, partial [Gammaproteobacteria bacterium]|nr:hypothetical protein [Gammaproteobacteria bacterium]